MASTNKYIKNGEIQAEGLLTPELLGKCSLTWDTPAPRGGVDSADDAEQKKKAQKFTQQYFFAPIRVTYPNSVSATQFYFPRVIIYNNPRVVGDTLRWPMAFTKEYAEIIQSLGRKVSQKFDIFNSRYSGGPDHVWTELKVYVPKAKSSYGGKMDISMWNGGDGQDGTITWKSIEDVFREHTEITAIECNVVLNAKIQVNVPKGENLSVAQTYQFTAVPAKINVIDAATIQQPVEISSKTAVTNANDIAKSSFFTAAKRAREAAKSQSSDMHSINPDEDSEFDD